MTGGQPDPLEGLLLRHARQRPTAEAVAADDVSFTYGELQERAAATAAGLAGAGVRAGDRVALRLGNTGAFVAAVMGCLWLGAAFVPVSPDDPPERVARILSDCRPKLLVGPPPEGVAVPAVDPGDLAAPGHVPAPHPPDARLDAYIIYTSGTTGAPKGVRISRAAFAWAVATTARALGFATGTRSLCVSSFHFDGSYSTLFGTLWEGGRVSIPRREDLLFVKRFYRELDSSGIDHTSFSPSYLRLLLRAPKAATLRRSSLSSIGLGGEECLAEDLRRLWEVHPEVRVFNLYGPTETTIQLTSYPVGKEEVEHGRVPIGTPHAGVGFHVCAAGTLAAEGPATGELYISGEQLMTGYWGDEKLTSAVMNDALIPGTVMYRTGDLVRRGAGGLYYYLGRADDVVKRHGVRISLGEVAAAARAVPGVAAAVCLALDIEGEMGLAVFAEAPAEIGPEKLRAGLGERLPATMMPDRLFMTAALPMSSSGKVDRSEVLRAFGCTPWTGVSRPD